MTSSRMLLVASGTDAGGDDGQTWNCNWISTIGILFLRVTILSTRLWQRFGKGNVVTANCVVIIIDYGRSKTFSTLLFL